MDIHPIRTESDYLAARKIIEDYRDTKPDPTSEAGEHFEVLQALIVDYEMRQCKIKKSELQVKQDELRSRYALQIKRIHQHSIWLFLATVGCLGIPQKHLQATAFVMTLAFFVYTAIQKEDSTSTAELKNSIRELKISLSVFGAEKEDSFDEIKISPPSFFNPKHSWIYFFSGMFFIASAWYIYIHTTNETASTLTSVTLDCQPSPSTLPVRPQRFNIQITNQQ